MDDDGVLEVGPQARAPAEQILGSLASGLTWPLGVGASALTGVLTAGLLPPRPRDGYRLSWGWREQQIFPAARRATRTALPALPAHLRYWPHYLSARRRLQQQ